MSWFAPTPLLVVFTPRGGSTFLAHCLDSHPDIGFTRGEPLHRDHLWRRVFPEATGEEILSLLLCEPGFRVAGCRVSYRQYRNLVGAAVAGTVRPRIIHLYREDVVRVAISSWINTHRLRPTHDYQPAGKMRPVEVDVKAFCQECGRYIRNVVAMEKELTDLGLPLLTLTYAQIVGGEGQQARYVSPAVADEICDFLGVQLLPLYTDLQRINPEPMRKLVANWPDLQAALIEAGYLEDDAA